MKEKISLLGVIANIFLAAGKIAVGLISHSAAILAEGVHSFIDVFSSSISYVGIKISKKPENEKYPYGYYKFEVLSGVIITFILFTTGIWIVYEAYGNLQSPSRVSIGYLAILVMVFSTIVNIATSYLKIYYGKKENSVSLLADGFHDRLDIFASLAVLVGLFFVKYWIYADALLALLIGLYIIKESFSIGKEAVDSLLDVSAGAEVEGKIKAAAKSLGINISSLKTQKKGAAVTANLEIVLPSNLSVNEATKISEELRKKLMGCVDSLSYVAIQIKSHEVSTNFYKPAFGRGFGWQRRGKFKEKVEKAVGAGPGGDCVCPSCGYRVPHKRSIPCSTLNCPKCNSKLERNSTV